MGDSEKKQPHNDAVTFDALASINLIVFGSYLDGLSTDAIHRFEASLDTCLIYKEIVRDFAVRSYPQEQGESNAGFDDRVEELTLAKVKIHLVCLASLEESDQKGFRDFGDKCKKLCSSMVVVDPEDPGLLFPNIEHALAMLRYRFSGDVSLYIDSGAQIEKRRLETLFRMLLEYRVTDPPADFRGNGYCLSRRDYRNQ